MTEEFGYIANQTNRHRSVNNQISRGSYTGSPATVTRLIAGLSPGTVLRSRVAPVECDQTTGEFGALVPEHVCRGPGRASGQVRP